MAAGPVRALLRMTAWGVVFLGALVGSLAYHLTLPSTWNTLAQGVSSLVSGELQGRIRIGRIDHLSLRKVVASEVEIFDPKGTRVIVAHHVELYPSLHDLAQGEVVVRKAILRGGILRLVPNGEGLPTFLDAFLPKTPSTGPNTVHVSLPDITATNIVAYGDVPGVTGLHAEVRSVRASVDVLDEFNLRILGGNVHVDAPYPYDVDLSPVTGIISSDPHVGMHIETHGVLGPDGGPPGDANVDVTYAVPKGGAAESPKHLALHIQAQPLTAAHLRDAGFAWAERLKGTFRGTLDLTGPTDHLHLVADLVTDGGPLTLDGDIAEGHVRVAAKADKLALDQVVDGSPKTTLTGTASLDIVGVGPNATQRLHVAMKPFTIVGVAVPAFEMSGTLLEDRIKLDAVDANVAGGTINIQGTATFTGDVDAHVTGHVADLARDPNFRKRFPGVHGAANVDADITVRNGAFRAAGKATLQNVTRNDVRIGKVVASGEVSNTEGPLTIHAQVALSDAAMGNMALHTFSASMDGTESQGYHLHITATASGKRSLVADAFVQLRGSRILVDSDHVVVRVDTKTWTGHVQALEVDPGKRFVLGEFLLASDPDVIRFGGSYVPGGDIKGHSLLRDVGIRSMTGLLGQPEPSFTGMVNAEMWADGTRAAPNLRLEASLKDAAYAELKHISAATVFSYEDGKLTVDAQGDVNHRGTATLSGNITADSNAESLTEAMEGALFDLNLRVDNLDARLLKRVKKVSGLVTKGEITGQLHFAGALFAPELDGFLSVPEVTFKGWPTLQVNSYVHYHNSYLVARVATKDDQGELAEAEGSLLVDLANLVVNPADAVASLSSLPWRLAVRIPNRSMRDMPTPIQSRLPNFAEDMSAAMSGTFEGGAFKTRGNVTLSLEWDKQTILGSCNGTTDAVVLIDANLADDVTIARATTFLGGQPMFNLEARAGTPINDWIEGATMPTAPATDVKLFMHEVPLESVPFACQKAKGPMSAEVDLEDLFTQKVHGGISVTSPGIRMGKLAPFHVNANLSVVPDEVRGKAKFGWESADWGTMDVSLPLRWGKRDVFPSIDGDNVTLAVDFSQAPIEPFVGLTPQIDEGGGEISGVVEARGTPGSMVMSGEFQLSNAHLKLAATGQRLVDINGNFILHSNWIELDQITARDGRGRLRVAGAISFEGWRPNLANIAVHASAFPLRREGAELASLTGSASIKSQFLTDGAELAVNFSQLAIRVPEASDRASQSLDSHPDITIRGEDDSAKEAAPYKVHVILDASSPFWVRRRDFAVQVGAELDVNYASPDLFIAGFVEMKGGHFDVYGRTFNIDWGAINFDGSAGIDPSVNLSAVHRLRGGGTVTVTVSGTLTNPEIAFSSTEATDPGEIVSLLVTGRAGHSSDTGGAEQQTANFVGGFLSGFLTLTLREAFGNYVPELTFDSNGLRAGQQLDFLIPKPLRNFVLGVYFEGQLAQNNTTTAGSTQTTDNSNNQASTNAQLLLELQFPNDIFFEGTWAPTDRWRLDVLWEP